MTESRIIAVIGFYGSLILSNVCGKEPYSLVWMIISIVWASIYFGLKLRDKKNRL